MQPKIVLELSSTLKKFLNQRFPNLVDVLLPFQKKKKRTIILLPLENPLPLSNKVLPMDLSYHHLHHFNILGVGAGWEGLEPIIILVQVTFI